MLLKIALATLVGALSGMLAATGGGLWPPSAGPDTAYGTRTVARVEAAWNTLRLRNGP